MSATRTGQFVSDTCHRDFLEQLTFQQILFELRERFAFVKEEEKYTFVHRVAPRSQYPYLKLNC